MLPGRAARRVARRSSVAVESALGAGPRALGDGGFGGAIGGHAVGRVGAADTDRPVALHRYALHDAARRIVVMGGVVLDRAVVPHHQRVGLPLNAQLILGDGGLAIEEGQQRVALVGLEVFYAHTELLVDVEDP